MTGKNAKKGVGDSLDLEHYHKIYGGLCKWRIENFLRGIEKEEGKNTAEGSILPFVRGLHFSAQLIYAIRELISSDSIKVDWGHLMDNSQKYCSRECDIIIYKGKHYGRWNGGIMDFRFVEQKNAIAVISCKSYLKSGAVDKQYVACLKPFVKKIWLFAECCDPKHTKAIKQQAQKAGYENFWYMYKWSRETTDFEPNEVGWLNFAKKLRSLKD
jgi:hypothetical protein